MPAVENGLGAIGREEGEFEDAPNVALRKFFSVGDVPERFELSGDEPVEPGIVTSIGWLEYDSHSRWTL